MSRARTGRGSGPHRPVGGVREAALLILTRVDGEGARADALLERWLPVFNDAHRDRALLTQLVNGTLRQRGYLDWLLGHFVKSGLGTLPIPVRNVLRLSLFQLEFMERLPPHAVVYDAVELARRYGHEGTARLANAVLRELQRRGREIPRPDAAADPVEAIAVLHSHPRWLVRRWVERWGAAEAEALARADNRIPPLTLRVNRLRADLERLREALEEEGLHPQPAELYPDALQITENVFFPGLRAYRQGLFQVQDEASCLVAPLLGARPGEMVLDLCAGPGGKATHLAEIMGGKGTVVAADTNPRALARLGENVRRLRITNVLPVRADGRTLALSRPADRVLVDAPCSGLGVLARRADARWRRQEGDVARFRALQTALLGRAADVVRPGGTILYATCTLEPEENEEVVAEVLAGRDDLARDAIAAEEGAPPGAVGEDGALRLYPHRHGCDGAFAARLKRREA